MVLRVAGYYRVSTERQDSNYSIPTQREHVRQYCQKNGFELLPEHEFEENYSGLKLNRPKLDELMALVRAGQIDGIVCHSTDRFSRQPKHALILLEELEEAGCRLFFVIDGEYPFGKPEEEALWLMKFSFNRIWVLKMQEAMRRGIEGKLASGSLIGYGTPRYGFIKQNEKIGKQTVTTLIPHEEEAEVVRDINRWFLEGVPVTDIVRRLNADGVPCPSDRRNWKRKQPLNDDTRTYSGWQIGTIYDMLKDPVYAGTHLANRWKVIDGKRVRTKPEEQIEIPVPPIISREVFDRVQEKLAQGRRKSKKNMVHEYLFSKRLRCSCGYAACCCTQYSKTSRTTGEKKAYQYYVCSSNTDGIRNIDCGMPYFRADVVDTVAWDYIRQLITDDAALEDGWKNEKQRVAEQAEIIHGRLEKVIGLIEAHELQKTRLLKLHLKGLISEEEFVNERSELDILLQGLAEERDTLTNTLTINTITNEQIEVMRKRLAELREGIENADFQRRRQIVEMLNMTVTLMMENGQKMIRLQWYGEEIPLPVDLVTVSNSS